jgi:hypothetical protein
MLDAMRERDAAIRKAVISPRSGSNKPTGR